MKRAGGWILGLLVVASMAGAAWFVVRPALHRRTMAVLVAAGDRGDTPTRRALLRGARQALDEATFRAGSFKIVLIEDFVRDMEPNYHLGPWFGTSEAILRRGDQQPRLLRVSAIETHPRDVSDTFQITPSFERQGRAAAAWAKKRQAKRVSLLYDSGNTRSEAIAAAFGTVAKFSGLEIEALAATSLNDVLAAKPDLVFYAGEDAPYNTTYTMFSQLREKGFNGPLITAEADPEVSFLATRPDLVDGTYLVSPFAPAPPELAKTMGTSPGPHVTAGYYAMKAALEAIDRADSTEPEDLRSAAAGLPYFDALGRAALRKCALYIARNGRYEFVELLD